MSLTISSAARTDVGRAREQNEDSCFAGEHLFVVADGLGGHKGGEVASAVGVETLQALADVDPERAAADLTAAVRAANLAVIERAGSDPGLTGMGTTMTAVVIVGATARLAHVGDSRCYLVRDGVIQQLTQDHTVVARMVGDGRLTPSEAETHPQRSMLTRALGSGPQVDVDVTDIALAPGDRLLLCSDGLTNMLSDAEIATAVGDGEDLEAICAALIDAANENGGVDNITTVLVTVTGSVDGSEPVLADGPADESSSTAPHRRVPRRAFVWLVIVLALAGAGVVGLQVWANGSWYVGHASDEVVVYRGLPMEVPLLRLQKVEERTGISFATLPDHLKREVDDGIVVDSLQDARAVVTAQIAPNAVPS